MVSDKDSKNNSLGTTDSDNRVKIIIDEPEKDASDFTKYADELFRIIVNSVPRFTVGIYGGWGTGKTTLMQMIKNRLETTEYKDDVITIWFDAWRYENEKYLTTIPLIRAIKIEIDNRINLALRNNKPVSKGLKRLGEGVTKTLLAFAKSTKLNASLKFLGAGAGVDLDTNEFMNILHSEGSIPLDNEEVHYRKHHITDFLAETVKAFIEEKIEKRRIVVFVDDLDRCTPEKALELLESIKTFFDIKGIIYVLGMDPRTINPIINSKYGKDGGIEGMDYLQKIVQLPFQIPVWSTYDISKTIRNMISKTGLSDLDINEILDETSVELIIRAAQLNPRDVKRFINTLILSKVIYGQSAKDFEKLIAVQAFYFRGNTWLDFLRLITPYKHRVEFLKKFIILTRSISSLADLDNLADRSVNKKELLAFDKTIEEIFKKLIELKDNDLFFFLKTSAVTIIKIDKIEKYLRAVESIDINTRNQIGSGLDIDIDTEKQLQLIRNGNVAEFNKMREKKSILIHLPCEELMSKDEKGEAKRHILSKINLEDAFLFAANLSGANLTNAKFSRADLSEANLSEAYLKEADLFHTNLSGANLSSAYLELAYLSSANLSGANLENAKFKRAKLSQANLSGANLSNAYLSRANLSRANLSRANLTEANLSGADLSYANLTGADLSYANLTGADLSYAILISVKFSTLLPNDTQFDYAITDDAEFIKFLQQEKSHPKSLPEIVKSKKDLESRLKQMESPEEWTELVLNLADQNAKHQSGAT